MTNTTVPLPTGGYRRLPSKVRWVFDEARRRFEFFGKRDGKTLEEAWVGLGYPSTYKAGVQAGFFRPLGDRATPRILTWYLLTEAGAAAYREFFPEADLPFDHDRAYAMNPVTP